MKQKHGREKKKSKSSFVCKHLIKYNVLMSILVRFIKIVFFLLLLAGSSSVYAACIVDGTSYNVGGTGLTSSSGAGGAITLAIIKDGWDTSGDDVSTCDVSTITSMYQIFRNEASFNQDIGTWDVSNVTTMSEMFYTADAFNQDISDWDVSSVTTMENMFYSADAFNQDISDWDTGEVTTMSEMFWNATAFNNGGVALDWSDTSKVTTMYRMFYSADAFNQDISTWDTGEVTTMYRMFYSADVFNNGGVALDWSDTSKVTTMKKMFGTADAFNQDISAWNVSNVTDMEQMFYHADAFNQDIGTWDVSKVTTMYGMFYDADAFNQDISTWDVSNVTDMNFMLRGPTLSTANYDALLIAWDALELQDNVSFDAPSSKYTASSVASTARASIISTDIWTIIDGGTVTDSSAPTLSSSSPADGATSVAVDANIVLTFSEKIYVKTGNITLKKSSDDSTVETIAVTDSKITGTGTTTITIDPSTTLDQETGYYLNIAATAFDDTASNSYAGISSTTALSFTTATAPTLSSSTPADNATAVAISSNIVLNFSEAVDVESGNITIYKTSDGSTVETIDVTSGLVTGIEKRLNI